MKRRGVFPHIIDVQHRGVTGKDARNNDVRGITSTIEGLPASVHPMEETEDIVDRDRAVHLVEVEALPHWHGANIQIPADDTFTWQSNTYELIGAAEVETDHLGRLDHLKFVGRRIVG